MGIVLKNEDLLLTLDEALALARSKGKVPEVWVRRVRTLGELGVVTYIAALGGALLAKATDDRVDSLAQSTKAGPRGYSLRSVTEFLAENNHGRFHLGATGRWPLNNRPFLGGPARIDAFDNIAGHARAAYELFLDCLKDLHRMDRTEASRCFAAYLRVRIDVAKREQEERRRSLTLAGALSADELLDLCERFVREDPEGGRRGQAFAAAVLDCVFAEVRLQPINNPRAGDVRVLRDGKTTLPVEVKQVGVNEATAMELAAEARELGTDAALLLVIAKDHEPLDRERVRRDAARDHGVLVEVCEGVREFVGAVAVFSGGTTQHVIERLPGMYAERMREHGVSDAAQRRWRELIEARSSAEPR